LYKCNVTIFRANDVPFQHPLPRVPSVVSEWSYCHVLDEWLPTSRGRQENYGAFGCMSNVPYNIKKLSHLSKIIYLNSASLFNMTKRNLPYFYKW
jgi:hypothetical protein